MNWHRYTVDRAAQDPRPGIVHHKSWYLTLFRGGSKGRDLGLRVETILQKPRPEFSARLHVGGGWSETPFDGHLTILGSGVYWGIGAGWKVAEWFTKRDKHRYEGRDLRVSIHDGKLWLSVWTHPTYHERGEFAEWRDRCFKLNPLDALFGERRYWYEDEAHAAIAVQMPEGVYPVEATLQRQLFGRPKLKKRVESWVVDVDAPKGIPDSRDLSGWKGDRVYGFSVSLREKRADWHVDAKAAIEAYILKNRAESGFREPEPVS